MSGDACSDSPYPLITAVLEAIPALTGTEDSGFNFTIYTGDLIPHDPSNELSRRVPALMLCQSKFSDTAVQSVHDLLRGQYHQYCTLDGP